MRALKFEKINEEQIEDFTIITARVKDANKLLSSTDFYHLTSRFGNGVWIKEEDDKQLCFKLLENQTLERLIDFYFNGSYYIEYE